MADVHENKTNKEEVRLMTYEDEANYDDVTIEEVLEEDQSQGNGKAGQKQSTRPESFDRVYEDNSNRQQKQGYQGYSQGYSQGYRTYGSGRGPRIFSVNLGRGTSLGKSWKYRIIGGLVAAAVLAFLLFVALPFLSVVVVVAMIAYLLYSFFG